ncbi:hypothetical protein PISMIDRAFT_411788 [Pisolithus microcarpus 441]|uniref:Uncharacterized protein n=1 Tax=Pisolithus microcarpus 441 TaxID=765257 RepID=A0A0C9YH52_9AGAM|nr:hypothetical protein PISMIDRAFT_411788 [Pisolithus microcarpus 441]
MSRHESILHMLTHQMRLHNVVTVTIHRGDTSKITGHYFHRIHRSGTRKGVASAVYVLKWGRPNGVLEHGRYYLVARRRLDGRIKTVIVESRDDTLTCQPFGAGRDTHERQWNDKI